MQDTRPRLIELAKAVRHFHKTLLAHTQSSYQKEYETVTSPFTWFSLVVNHAHFAWLRPLTAYLSTLDEVTDAKTPLGDAQWQDAVSNLQNLFSPLQPEFKEFNAQYKALKHFSDVQQAELRWRNLIQVQH